MKPQVSVIIPVYNTADYLHACLDSICAQTLKDIEIICVDDGSTDDSLSILNTYRQSDERITVLTQSNLFAGTARNNGMQHASGEFLLFFDSDDFMEPTMLEALVNRAHETNADVIVCRSDLLDDATQERTPCAYSIKDFGQGEVFRSTDCADHLFQIFIGWPWDKMFRHSLVSENGLTFQGIRSSNDAFFVFSALAEASCIATTDETLAVHRTHNSNSIENTRDRSSLCFLDAIKAIDEELRDKDIYTTFERSFVNWVMEFSVWQISTMKPEKLDEVFAGFNGIVLPLVDLDNRPEDFFSDPTCLESFKALTLPPNEVRVNFINAMNYYRELDRYYHEEQQMRYGAEGAVRDLKEIISRLDTDINALREQSAAKDEQLEEKDRLLAEREQELDDIKSSKAYRLGSSLAKPVRAIKSH